MQKVEVNTLNTWNVCLAINKKRLFAADRKSVRSITFAISIKAYATRRPEIDRRLVSVWMPCNRLLNPEVNKMIYLTPTFTNTAAERGSPSLNNPVNTKSQSNACCFCCSTPNNDNNVTCLNLNYYCLVVRDKPRPLKARAIEQRGRHNKRT